MIKRLALLLPDSAYGVLTYFTEKLHAALIELQQFDEVLLLNLNRTAVGAFQQAFFEKNVQALVVFNSLFADAQGKLFCDRIKLPTIYCLVDALYHFSVVPSEYAILGFVDRGHRHYAEECGYLRTFDLPHAVADGAAASPTQERPYGCALFATAIDYRYYAAQWQSLPSPLYLGLRRAAENLLCDSSISIPEAFFNECSLPEGMLPHTFLHNLDLYVKGRGRVALLQALKPLPIDLFGNRAGWEALLGDNCPHVTLHDPLPYTDVLERMARTKVVLNSCEAIRDGAHERVLAAVACGAAAVARKTPFLEESFPPGHGIVYYGNMPWDGLKESVGRLLVDEEARSDAVLLGQRKLQERHLWRHRAKALASMLAFWADRLPQRDPI